MAEIEATRQLTRGEAADYLRKFADQLDDRDQNPLSAGLYAETDETDPSTDAGGATDGRVTILVGNDSATVNPTDEIGFGVQVGRDDSLVGTGSERYVTFDLTWNADEVDDDSLDIE